VAWYRQHGYSFRVHHRLQRRDTGGRHRLRPRVPGSFQVSQYGADRQAVAPPSAPHALGVTCVPALGRRVTECGCGCPGHHPTGGVADPQPSQRLSAGALRLESCWAFRVSPSWRLLRGLSSEAAGILHRAAMDGLVSAGRVIYGVAADDAHDFSPEAQPAGRAW